MYEKRQGLEVMQSLLKLCVVLAATCVQVFCDRDGRGPVRPVFNWDEIKQIFAFGDSYTFVQGSHGFPNFSFIGDAFNLAFTPHELSTNEIIARNTSSDGSNWTEFLTGCFSGRPSRCSHQLWNFAFAGSDIDGAILPLHHNFTVPLVDQVKQWVTYAADFIPHRKDSSLVAWWIGINDTGDTTNNKTIDNYRAFSMAEMTSYFKAVETVYTKGLRNFLFLNVPPEERSPARVNDSVGGPVLKQNIIVFNAVLQSFVANFAREHSDTNVFSFDAHSWFNTVLNNAPQYGFTNTTGFCTCSDDTYFWYNTGHPTERVHFLLANAIEGELRKSQALHNSGFESDLLR